MPVALTTICGVDEAVSSWITNSDMVGITSGRSADMLEPEVLVRGDEGPSSQGSSSPWPIGVQRGMVFSK